MSEIMHLDIEKARLEPDAVFARPADLVQAVGLTRGQKIAALRRWELLMHDKMRATDEGMEAPTGRPTTEATTIQAIGEALESIAAPPAPAA
jgi:hypothetical protein